jgi:hypothetical protein
VNIRLILGSRPCNPTALPRPLILLHFLDHGPHSQFLVIQHLVLLHLLDHGPHPQFLVIQHLVLLHLLDHGPHPQFLVIQHLVLLHFLDHGPHPQFLVIQHLDDIFQLLATHNLQNSLASNPVLPKRL